MLDIRVKWEYAAINYINTDSNSYLAGTSEYISKHLVEEDSLNMLQNKQIQNCL